MRSVLPYWVAQVLGAIVGAGLLYVIASGAEGFDVSGGFASNGFGEHSPGHYSLMAALVMEFVARSTGPALFVGGWALSQLWAFWLAPLAGGAAGGALYRWLSEEPSAPVVGEDS